MTSKELVISLYRAYALGDPIKIAELLHEEVIWVAPQGNATQVALGLGKPNDAGAPRGSNNLNRSQIINFMAYNFARFFGDVKNDFRTIIAEGNIVVVEHRLTATLPNGRHYINDYCFIYEVRDDKVWRIREYMDTRGGWAQVFGDDEAKQILDFIVH